MILLVCSVGATGANGAGLRFLDPLDLEPPVSFEPLLADDPVEAESTPFRPPAEDARYTRWSALLEAEEPLTTTPSSVVRTLPAAPTVADPMWQTPGPAGPIWANPQPLLGGPMPPRRRGLASFFGPRGDGRNQGVGQPLLCESWRYRPFGIGWFMGMMHGSTLVNHWTGTDTGYFGGYRLTWDYDHYWGCEFRYGFGSLPQWDSAGAKAAQEAADTARGLTPADPEWHRYDHRRDASVAVWDVSLVYYPWGDAAWRPYALMGFGGARVSFDDRLAEHYVRRTFAMPMGFGVKYRWNERLALRIEVLDNIIFGHRNVETQHNLSLVAGVEIRFGGTRKAYWPWNPGRHYW
ncbi:MAG: outer membrane beta-barrel protein [Pirellulales bacterium]|nr:outer membrane beta-barrel protein [Pirellulales bacterium]